MSPTYGRLEEEVEVGEPEHPSELIEAAATEEACSLDNVLNTYIPHPR